MKKETKPAKIKIPAFFTKKYTDKQYQKKILKKLFVPADKKLVESVFTTTTDPKKGHVLHTINAASVTTPDQAKKLAVIAKQLKAQKGRFNLTTLIAACLCILALVLVLTVFRKPIARFVVVSSMEGIFGAKCEMSDIDINLLQARFLIDGLTVANRNSVMKNLFGIGRFDLHFDLLELSRGKIVAENIEITGVTWNTDRKSSGALPPAKQKAFDKKQANAKPNPVMTALTAEMDKLKTGVSLDAGIGALKDQLDPVQFLEKEKASLKTPALVAEITTTVPELTSKWETKNTEVRAAVDKTIKDGKKVSALKIDSIKTVPEAQAALEEIQSAMKNSKDTIATAQETAAAVNEDAKKVSALSKEADAAYKADSLRLKSLVDSVKSVNLTSGKKMVSGIFKSFAINTLGNYYPYLDRGISSLKAMQNGKDKPKALSLKKKSGAMSRLPGHTFAFGDNSMPNLLLKNIALSAADTASGISGKATVQNITNDADRIDKPITILAEISHGKMNERLSGTVDVRSKATELVDAGFTASGYPLAIASSGQSGVPSVNGSMKATGTIGVATEGTVTIGSDLLVTNAKLTVDSFEPAMLYNAYRESLAGISDIQLKVTAVISPDKGMQVDVGTNLDAIINQALQDQMAKQTDKLKEGVRREGEAYLAAQKKQYSDEISRFTDVSGKSKAALDDIKQYDKTLQAKKTEAEKKVQSLVAGKAAPVVQKAASTATGKLKKLF